MKIAFSKNFIKGAKKLPKQTREKLHARIILFVENQTHHSLRNHALAGKYKEYRSIDITGDVRVLYFNLSDYEIVFDEIGTHSQLYG